MKRKNYALKFSLSITLAFILPILITINIIVLIIYIANNEVTKDNLLTSLLILLMSLGLSFAATLLVGFITYLLDKSSIFQANEDTITNGTQIIKRSYIVKARVRKILFIYSYTIYTKPWKRLGTWTYYFNNKEEVVEFLNTYTFLKEYLIEKDLIKLEIDR